MRLKHMQFYGRFDARCDVAGFSIARMLALKPGHEVEPHEHEDGHFIVVMEGHYRSSARGVTALLGPGDVLWNPPGTRRVPQHIARPQQRGHAAGTAAVVPLHHHDEVPVLVLVRLHLMPGLEGQHPRNAETRDVAPRVESAVELHVLQAHGWFNPGGEP